MDYINDDFELDDEIEDFYRENINGSNRLELNDKYEGELTEEILEFLNSCKQLEIGEAFNSDISKIPESVIKISFTDFSLFNQSIDNLHDKVEILEFGEDSHFNQKVNHWPQGLKEIYFLGEFNQSIDNLPNGIQKIYFSSSSKFSQKVNQWSNSLEILWFDYQNKYNQSFINLPKTLIDLYLGQYNLPLNNLPSNLKYLQVGDAYSHYLDNLPLGLEELVIGDENWMSKYNLSLDFLPHHLKALSIYSFEFNQELNNLPNSLLHLTIHDKYRNKLPDIQVRFSSYY